MAYKAVVIGVNEYIDTASFAPLINVKNDIDAIIQILRNSVCKYEISIISGKNSISERIISCLNKFFDSCDENDILFLYWAGHGYSNNFITYDTDSNRLSKTSIKMSIIKSMIENSKSETIISIFDCCYSGGIVRKDGVILHLNIIGTGKAIITSSDYYQVSHEHDKSGHGLFTTYFLEGLMGVAASENGEITLTRLYNYIYEKMKSDNKAQTPILNGTLVGDIILDKIN